MAYILNRKNSNRQYLLPHHNFGRRAEAVDTFIDQAEVSKIHAIIEWNGDEWHIRDVSHNGTWLDNEKLVDSRFYKLKQGQTIYFAGPETEGWVIEDLSPPRNQLLPLNNDSNEVDLSLSGYHLLPSDNEPKVALYLCPDRGQWYTEALDTKIIDIEENNEPLTHGDRLLFENYEWEMFLPVITKPTQELSTQALNLSQFEFIFDVSQDEENVTLKLRHEKQFFDLEERTHHYLLLHLARCRMRDAAANADEKNQGWVYNDDLAKDLGLDGSHLNIQIFRARKQLSEELKHVSGLSDLIQRRRGSTRIGCTCEHLKIYKGSYIEDYTVPNPKIKA